MLGLSSRRRRVSLVLSAIAALLLLDAACIEPQRLETTHVAIATRVRSPLRIAHLTDLHGSTPGRLEGRVLESIANEHPDVIVLTGDTVDNGHFEPYGAFLRDLHAPLGVFAVQGNWEHWRVAADEAETLQRAGVTLLVNENRRLRDDAWLIGLDDATGGSPNVDRALEGSAPDEARIALFHSPIAFDRVSSRIDVALAGHTHGGQVRVPFLDPLWLPRGSGDFVSGRHERDGATLYVSRGVGTSILPLRFQCRPELAIVDLVPK